MSIEEYFGDWLKVVDVNEAEALMKRLIPYKSQLCPQPKDIFKAFRLCSYDSLRSVIVAQDPYPDIYKGRPRATGIAFANTSDTPEEDLSPSLNILKESVINYLVPHRTTIFDPSLEKWEEQGVLLLNSALSCLSGRPGSHSLLWRPFMKSLLLNLSRHKTGIVYVLMGSQAQSYELYINQKFNHIIRIRHPAWYARQKIKMPSETWQEINNILIGQNGYGIEWFKEY